MRVIVNRVCNQRCGFCDGRADRDSPEHADAPVREAIARAAATGEATLSGGEPALRAELPAWIALAREAGARVAIETNGTAFAYRARARAVAAAGLAEARVALPAGDDAAADEITRDPGGLARALDGIAHLTGEGVEVVVTIPLTDRGAPSIARLVERAAAAERAPGRVSRFVAHLLRGAPPLDRARLERFARALAEGARAAAHLPGGRRPFGVARDAAVPPCAFDRGIAAGVPESLERLLDGIQGALAPACRSCALAGPCPGPSPLIDPAALSPLDPAAARRAAPLLGDRPRAVVDDAVSSFHYFDAALDQLAEGATVRLTYGCNQKCPMCFVDTSLGAVPERMWRDGIAEAAARGARYLQLSGGEPTLSPHVASAIALARAGGFARIELQTNALACAEPGFARALAAAGLTHALVSLHGATDAIADRVTLSPGTAARTALGADALLEAGVAVQLHFVVNGMNYPEAPAFVERVHSRWGTRASILFSFVAPMDRVPKEPWLVPRYSDAAPPLRAALDACSARGIAFAGLGSFCGLPLCVLDGDPRYYPDKQPVPAGSVDAEFVHPAACEGCRERPSCRGVRAAYATLHGTAEIHPLY